jgi:hypothetical protein
MCLNNLHALKYLQIKIWNVILEIMGMSFLRMPPKLLCWCKMCLNVGGHHFEWLF